MVVPRSAPASEAEVTHTSTPTLPNHRHLLSCCQAVYFSTLPWAMTDWQETAPTTNDKMALSGDIATKRPTGPLSNVDLPD